MLFDNILHHRQPQPGAVRFGGEIGGEDGLQLFGSHPFTAICDDDFHPLTVSFACRYANDAVTANRLHRVQVQVQQHLVQAVGIGVDRGELRARSELQRYPATLRILADQL